VRQGNALRRIVNLRESIAGTVPIDVARCRSTTLWDQAPLAPAFKCAPSVPQKPGEIITCIASKSCHRNTGRNVFA
jgi:hypothetical protein